MSIPIKAEGADAHDEAQIRQLISDWIAAQCRKDIDGVMSHYAADVSVFGLTPPLLTQGAASWRSVWEARLPHFPAGFQTEMRDLRILVSGTVAVAHWLFRFVGVRTDLPAVQSWFRITVGYQKRQGRWQIVHEHYSAPFDPATSQAVFTLD
jgi:ketosteroid isomerase-like protein